MEQILAEVKTFKRVVLVCASCKKIRDDNGNWNPQEAPISAAPDVIFSHGLCPDCIWELYPEVAEKVLERQGSKPTAECGG